MAVSTTTVSTRQTDCKSEIAGDATVNNEQKYIKKPHIRDQPITLGNWYKHVNWLHAVLLTTTPILAIYGLFTTELWYKTAIWTVIYYYFTGLGITAGYHRYWAHRSYSASRLFQFMLLVAGSGAVEGSARWWCRDHRAHHRYTDTDKDPYSASKGLLYSHVGWMYLKQNPERIGRADISDLNADPLLQHQHKYYGLWALTCGFVISTIVPGIGWGDWRGGFFFSTILRLVFVHHATFCVNSLAHYLGDSPYDDKHTPRDHFITAILSLGEGYHNFHHEFPQDYRNAIRFYQYDPTKWIIRLSSFIGMTFNLKRFPENEVQKGQVMMKQEKLDILKSKLDWGTPLDKLPVFTFEEFQKIAQTNNWILVEGVIYDVSDYINEHPGGVAIMKSGIGKDMTTSFNGGVYDHSNAARNLMARFRTGVVSGGGEVESRKTQ